MKFLILLLISFTASASYLPKSKVGQDTDGMTIYSKKEKCEKVYAEKCVEIKGEENKSFHVFVDDKNKKSQSSACVDEADCQSQFEALVCDAEKGWSPVKNLDQLEIYCTKFVPAHIEVDPVAKQAYDDAKDAEKAAKLQAKADRKAEIEELKGFISDINASDLPVWHKKILKFLVKETKE